MKNQNKSNARMKRISRKLMAGLFLCLPFTTFAQIPQVGTLAGSGGFADAQGAAAQFNKPSNMVIKGNTLYVADEGNGRIRAIDKTTGNVTTVASSIQSLKAIAISPTGDTLYYVSQANGSTVFNVLELSSRIVTPYTNTPLGTNVTALAVGSNGVVYIADTDNQVIRRFRPSFGFRIFAGTTSTTGQRNGKGDVATFNAPRGLALSADQKLLYVADSENNLIRQISLTGFVVGTSYSDSVGTLTSTTGLNKPWQLSLNNSGDTLLVAGGLSNRIQRVSIATGVVSTFAGSSSPGFADGTAKNMNGAPELNTALFNDGVVYNGHYYYASKSATTWTQAKAIAEANGGHLVTIQDAAENSLVASMGGGWIGLTDEVTEGSFQWVTGEPLTFTSWNNNEPNNSGNEDYAEMNGSGGWNDNKEATTKSYVIEIEPQGPITTIPASLFNSPRGLAVSGSDVYVADYNNNRIRLISEGNVTTFAGSGLIFDAQGQSARLNNPNGVAIDTSRNVLYFTDRATNALRAVDLITNDVTTVTTSLNLPNGVALSATGDSIFVVNQGNSTISLVLLDGTTKTYAGSGNTGFTNGIGTAASFNNPTDLVRVGGVLYVVDRGNRRIRRINISTQAVEFYAGEGVANIFNDSQFRDQANFSDPKGIEFDGTSLYITDGNRIRKIANVNQFDVNDPSLNPVSTFAGSLTNGSGSNNGIGTAASFNSTYGIVFDGADYLYITSDGDRSVRRLQISNQQVTNVITSASADFADGAQGTARFQSQLRHIEFLNNKLYIADAGNDRVRLIEFIPNSGPSFVIGTPTVSVNEDSPLQTIAGFLTNISPGSKPTDAGQTVSFVLANSNSSLFAQAPAISNNGTLTFRTALNAFGTAVIRVQAQDNGGIAGGGTDTSAVASFTIVINNTPDVPSVSAINNQTIFTGSCRTIPFTVGNLDGPADSLKISVSSSDTLLIPNRNINISGSGASRNIGFCAVYPNFGSSQLTVRVANADTSFTRTFTVTVPYANTPPSFTRGKTVQVLEDAGLQTIPNWATNISKGLSPADTNQQLTFIVTANNPNNTIFNNNAGYPRLSADGTLAFAFVPNFFGTVKALVRLQDNGGTNNGGNNTSVTDTITFEVMPVNDAPVISNFRTPTNNNTNLYSVFTYAQNSNTGRFTYTVSDIDNVADSLVVSYTKQGTLQLNPDSIVIGGSGSSRTISLRTPVGRYGRDTIFLSVTDPRGLKSNIQPFIIAVNTFNTPPTLTLSRDTIVLREDSPSQTLANFITNIKKGISAIAENGQTLTFRLTPDNPSLFSIQPSAATLPGNVAINTRDVTFTPAKDAAGITRVAVIATDNGNNPNNLTSEPVYFFVRIIPVNDAPTISSITNRSLAMPRKGEPSVAPITVTFTARDADTPPASLKLITQFDTSRLVILPTLSGTNGNMVISVRPINFTCDKDTSLTVPVAIIIADDSGATARSSFNIVLTTRNPAPNGCLARPVVSLITDTDSLISSVTGSVYEWFVNGTKVDTLTTRKIKAGTNAGNYQVQVRMPSGDVTPKSNVFVYTSLSKQSTAFANITVYPNPAADELNIRFSNDATGAYILQVIDAFGRVVKQEQLNKSDIEANTAINLSGLAAGKYAVRISAAKFAGVVKFIKK